MLKSESSDAGFASVDDRPAANAEALHPHAAGLTSRSARGKVRHLEPRFRGASPNQPKEAAMDEVTTTLSAVRQPLAAFLR